MPQPRAAGPRPGPGVARQAPPGPPPPPTRPAPPPAEEFPDLQNLQRVENRLIEHFSGNPMNPSEEAALGRELEQMAGRARDLQINPSKAYCLLLRDLLKVRTLDEISALKASPWHKANLRYVLGYRGGPATALTVIQRGRVESQGYLDRALDHVALDYGPDRGEILVADHSQGMDLKKELAGKDVVDLGGARGAFAAALTGFVGPKGSVTVVEIDPGFAGLIAATAPYDKRFTRVGFRLGQLDDTRLPEASVDVLFINEVHLVGKGAGAQEYQKDILPWVRSVFRALRPGGKVVVYELHPPPSAGKAAACLREVGFAEPRVVLLPAPAIPGSEPGYVMSALRPSKP